MSAYQKHTGKGSRSRVWFGNRWKTRKEQEQQKKGKKENKDEQKTAAGGAEQKGELKYHCHVCNTNCRDDDGFRKHMNSARHQDRMLGVLSIHEEKSVQIASRMTVEKHLRHLEHQHLARIMEHKQTMGSGFCEVCDIALPKMDLLKHQRTTFHRKRRLQVTKGCGWCNIECFYNFTDVLAHRQTSMHRKNQSADQKSEGKPPAVTPEKVRDDRQAAKGCSWCDVAAFESVADMHTHRATEKHKQNQKEYNQRGRQNSRGTMDAEKRLIQVMKGCGWCSVPVFKNFAEVLAHRETDQHKENQSKHGKQNRRSSKASNDSDRGGDKSKVKTPVKKRRAPIKFEMPENLAKFDADTAVGQECVVPVTGFICKLCDQFFKDETLAKESHCKSEAHFKKYKNSIHTELKAKAVAERLAKEKAEAEEEEEERKKKEEEEEAAAKAAEGQDESSSQDSSLEDSSAEENADTKTGDDLDTKGGDDLDTEGGNDLGVQGGDNLDTKQGDDLDAKQGHDRDSKEGDTAAAKVVGGEEKPGTTRKRKKKKNDPDTKKVDDLDIKKVDDLDTKEGAVLDTKEGGEKSTEKEQERKTSTKTRKKKNNKVNGEEAKKEAAENDGEEEGCEETNPETSRTKDFRNGEKDSAKKTNKKTDKEDSKTEGQNISEETKEKQDSKTEGQNIEKSKAKEDSKAEGPNVSEERKDGTETDSGDDDSKAESCSDHEVKGNNGYDTADDDLDTLGLAGKDTEVDQA